MPADLLAAGDVRPAEPDLDEAPSRPADGLRLLTLSLAIALLVFAQRTGQVATDTKLDLVVDPARFLARALDLWDPTNKAGGLQNQAYGYLFPMGPFFALGHWLHLAPWVVQRAWESALLIASFLGTFRVARLLGVRGFWPPVVAGLVYALSPRMLAELTSISAELTPTVALPWILAPLIRGASTGSTRRSAALSGVALLFAGGTNAAATLAVLPAPAIWLLTRHRGPRRRALLGYWVFAVVLASLWWALPLLLLGRYSPPFLDWIEAAQNTTATTSLSAVLRGVPHWENYLGPGIWPAGWIYVSSSVAIVATTLVAAAGLFGLGRSGRPHRGFLLACLLTGLVLVTVGHVTSIGPPFADQFRHWLDGPLVAFRNIHKFEPLVRFPIAMGCAFAVAQFRLPAWRTWSATGLVLRLSPRAFGVACMVLLGVVVLAPAMGGRLVAQPRLQAMAPWWPKAADWLAGHADRSRALIVPGAPKPSYIWGDTVDDAMEPVARSPWIARDSTPLYQAGTERLLTEVEDLLATGRPVPELAPLLARSGFGFVVLRNDLEAVVSAATPQSIVRATLTSSPGLNLVKRIGPGLGGGTDRNDLIDGGALARRPAIEIFAVQGAAGPASVDALGGAVAANGSTDQLAPLIRTGLGAGQPVLFGAAASSGGPPVPRVATDGIRRQQASFGGTFARSGTLTADQPFHGRRAAYDFLPTDPGPLSTIRFIGLRDVSASSSGSDATARRNVSPAYQPWSALDGQPDTSWRSGARGAVDEWLQVQLDGPASVPSVSVAFTPGLGPYPSAVRITTDAGIRVDAVRPTARPQTLVLPKGATSFVRLAVAAVRGGGLGLSVGISTLSIPGLAAARTLDVPAAGAPDRMTFSTAPGYRSGCLPVRVGVTCQDDLAAAGEEDDVLDRSIRLTRTGDYQLATTVRLVGGAQLDRLLDSELGLRASASSVEAPDPRVRAGAALDGDPTTTWIARQGDARPTLTVDLPAPRSIEGVLLHTAAGAAAAAPQKVRIRAADLDWVGPVPASGRIEFDHAVRAGRLRITVLEAQLRKSTSSLTGQGALVPAGITSLTLLGAGLAEPGVPAFVNIGCGDGLTAVVDGFPLPLSVFAPVAAVLAGEPVAARPCSPAAITLRAGAHRFTLGRTPWSLPVGLTFTRTGAAPWSAAAPVTPRVLQWGSSHRRVAVRAADRSVLVVHENVNAGWVASVGGRRLQPIEVDGWQQGFVLPAGTSGVVVLDYQPQRAFDLGLIAGLVAVLLLLAGAAVRGRADLRRATGEIRVGSWMVTAGLAVGGGLLAGPAGVITAVAVRVLLTLLDDRGRLAPRLAAAAFVVAGLDIALADPIRVFDTADSGTVQLLALAAVSFAFGLPRPGALRRHGRVP